MATLARRKEIEAIAKELGRGGGKPVAKGRGGKKGKKGHRHRRKKSASLHPESPGKRGGCE